jgi:hypothetical protein
MASQAGVICYEQRMLYRVPPGTRPAAVATARKAGKMIRATLVAFALLSAAPAPVA